MRRIREQRIKISDRKYAASSMAFLIAAALITAFIVEWRARAGDAGEAFSFALHNIRPFIIETFVLIALMAVVAALLGDALIGAAVVFNAFVVMTFIHANKMAARSEPFLPEDFTFILNFGDVATMTKPMDNLKQILLIAGVFVLCIGASVLLRFLGVKQLGIRTSKFPRARIGALVISAALLVIIGCSFVFPKNTGKFETRIMGVDLSDWDQSANYRKNGFVIGFMYNMAAVRMDRPNGYSRRKVLDITKRYAKRAKEENSKRNDPADSDTNIVYIMNESFCNPNGLKEYYPYEGGNAVSFAERLSRDNPSGNIITPAFGGGTAIVEFEALTGFSNWFRGVTLPYHFYVKKQPTFPSIAAYLKKQGYKTTAMHPYSGLMYDRKPAFKAMDFSEFKDQKSFENTAKDRSGHYISDESAYKELLQTLEATDEKQFALLITMQNHTPYGNQYSEEDRRFTSAANITEEENDAISDYLELIGTSDEALEYLIGELNNFDEKTLVVFWGDHLPGVYASLPDTEIKKWETPFIIYANYDVDAEPINGGLGDISPNYISAELLRTANIKAPAFYYLLDDVKAADPTLTRRYPHKAKQPDSEALRDYETIQYDVMSGDGYSLETDFFG